jgi:hypothetical protein
MPQQSNGKPSFGAVFYLLPLAVSLNCRTFLSFYNALSADQGYNKKKEV